MGVHLQETRKRFAVMHVYVSSTEQDARTVSTWVRMTVLAMIEV